MAKHEPVRVAGPASRRGTCTMTITGIPDDHESAQRGEGE